MKTSWMIFCLCATCLTGMAALPTSRVSPPAQPRTSAPAPAYRIPNQEQARDIAETMYNTWRLSMLNSDYQAWKSATSFSRQAKVHNLVVSERRPFPAAIFGRQATPPALGNLRYVGALGGPQGNTLAATYYGKIDLGLGGEPTDNALVLLFVEEGGKWRYDQSRFFNLAHLPQVRERLARGDASVLKEQDGFHAYDAPPATPPLCAAPQLIGKVFVDAPDRRIDMTINGISHHVFEDCRLAEVVSGGLRRGKNTIAYTIRPLSDRAAKQPMAVGLFVMPETKGNHPATCFEHIADAGDNPQGGSFTFTVSDEMIRAMNPAAHAQKPAPFRPVPLKNKPSEGK